MHAYLYPHVLPQSWLLNIYQQETICNEKISDKFYKTELEEVEEKEIDESVSENIRKVNVQYWKLNT